MKGSAALTAEVIYQGAHDGDTVYLDLALGLYGLWIRGQRYRIRGISAPELSEPSGSASRDALAARIEAASTLDVTIHRSRTHGRYVIDMLADGEDVGTYMIAAGFAAPYSG